VKTGREVRAASGRGGESSPRWLAFLLAITVAVAAFGVHVRALQGAILRWDDWDQLVLETRWRGLGAENLAWMVTTGHRGHFQPLSWISYALEYELAGMSAGLDARVFHATNLALHALVAALVFILARKVLALGAPQVPARWRDAAAALGALLFAVHPLRVESVAWITERRDVLSGVFFVGAAIAWLSAGERGSGGRLSRPHAWAAFALMVLCVLSKAYGMVLPAVFLVLDGWPLRRFERTGWKRLVLEKTPFLLVSAAVALLALKSQDETGALTGAELIDLPSRLRLVVHALAFYPLKTLAPTNLSPLYAIPCGGVASGATYYAELAAVAALCAVAWWARRRCPAFTAAWCVFVITILPVSGIALSGPQAAADRYSYHSCIGFALLAGAVVLSTRMRAVALSAGVAAAIALSTATWRQTTIWRDDLALWNAAIERGGPLHFAYTNRGIEYLALNDLGRAEADFRAALAECKAVVAAHVNLAFLLGERGDWVESERSARAALQLEPQGSMALQHLGRALVMTGRIAEAEQAYAGAVQSEPDNALLRYRHADLLQSLGRLDEARAEAERATQLQPADPLAWEKLAQTSAALGRAKEARDAADRAVELASSDLDLLLLAAELRLAAGDAPAARSAFERVLELAPEHPRARARLAELP
jgi:tetratricopeptide (TPR) repeat protein